mmetsp:Transcript_17600/g.54620  ORF Transcript_17600/g.54620 Transcript_17600/m.54620 type:complete len:204 (+) Transcript_17600:277-888(+)
MASKPTTYADSFSMSSVTTTGSSSARSLVASSSGTSTATALCATIWSTIWSTRLSLPGPGLAKLARLWMSLRTRARNSRRCSADPVGDDAACLALPTERSSASTSRSASCAASSSVHPSRHAAKACAPTVSACLRFLPDDPPGDDPLLRADMLPARAPRRRGKPLRSLALARSAVRHRRASAACGRLAGASARGAALGRGWSA